jgi:deoxyribodipyrimidine photolyase
MAFMNCDEDHHSIALGDTYPRPVVDLAASRAAALAAFAGIK